MGTYQSRKDEENQTLVMGRLEALWGVDLIGLPVTAKVDAVACKDGQAKALIEIKVRAYTYAEVERFGDIYVDRDKIAAGQSMAKMLAIKFLFVVKLTDRLLCLSIHPDFDLSELRSTVSRLNSPRDMNDEDDVVRLPIHKFKVIE